jgi:hypothetical protein
MRLGTLGLALGGKWLYLPFTEYDDFAGRVTTSYYSEAIGVANASLHLFPGYYFYGLAVGASAKLAYRSIPDYSDDAGTVIPGSGGQQSALAVLADFGVLTRFNLLKLYSSREKNFSVGLAIKNIGPAIKDEPMPTVATAGLAYSFLKPILVSADVSFPVNLVNPALSEAPYWGVGYRMTITDFWKLQAGFLIKGGNPRISVGAALDFSPLEVNYTLDLTTQFSPLNRMSIEARFDMGDLGRSAKAARAEDLYLQGLDAYAAGDLELAITYWNESLKLNPYFDPARENRDTAQASIELRKRMLELQRLE